MSKDACGPEGQVCRLHAWGGAGLLRPDAMGPRRGALVHVDSWNAPCTEVNPPSDFRFGQSCLCPGPCPLNPVQLTNAHMYDSYAHMECTRRI